LLSEIYDGWNSNPPLQGIDQIQDLLSRYPGNRHLLYYLAVEQRNAGKYYYAIANLDILIIKYPADQQARSLLTDTINKNL
jgi:cytochrome c-type biogenesis protein CcmH/NrfG